MSTDSLRDKLIQKGWVTNFNADTLVKLIEEHYAALAAELEGHINLKSKSQEVARFDAQGFHYRGQFIEDAGEAHRLLVEFLRQHQPIPVSERLPGPEDCDAEGRCWVWWKNGVRWVLDDWTPSDFQSEILSSFVSHWLPANALPLPSGEVK